jgi:hypothetical protein
MLHVRRHYYIRTRVDDGVGAPVCTRCGEVGPAGTLAGPGGMRLVERALAFVHDELCEGPE